MQVGPAFVAVMLVLAALGAGVVAGAGLGQARQVLTAVARGAVQLAVIAGVITAVLGSLVWAALFIAVMCSVATATAGRRLRTGRRSWWLLLPIAATTLPLVVALIAVRLVPAQPIVIVPLAGILIGGAMTATTLAGRRAFDDLHVRHGEVEAALAIGLLDQDARLEVARPAAAQALIPPLDQTRTVGLVTLPGAFVGMLLGGASPLQAAGVQLLGLVGLLAAEAVAVAAVLELICRGALAPSPSGAA